MTYQEISHIKLFYLSLTCIFSFRSSICHGSATQRDTYDLNLELGVTDQPVSRTTEDEAECTGLQRELDEQLQHPDSAIMEREDESELTFPQEASGGSWSDDGQVHVFYYLIKIPSHKPYHIIIYQCYTQ